MEVKLYLQMLRRSWWIIVITTLATVIAALVISYMTPPTYQATSRFIVSPSPSLITGGSNLLSSLSTLDKRSIVTTYAEIMNSQRIFTETTGLLQLNKVDLSNYSYRAVALPEANIIEFSVTGPDRQVVYTLANAIGQHAVEYVHSLYQVYDLSVLDAASPPSVPISPLPLRSASVALVVGLALGILLALLREMARTPLQSFVRQRTVDEMSLALNRKAFDECEQRADVHHLHDRAQWQYRGDESGENAEPEGQLGRRPGTRIDGCPGLRHQPVAGHREEDPGLAVEDHEQHAGDGHQRSERGQRGRPRKAGTLFEGLRQRRVALGQLGCGQSADGRNRHQDVDDGADHQRADDRDRQVTLGVLGLLASSGHGVEADVGEEDQGRCSEHSARALRRERLQVVGVEGGERKADEHGQHGELDEHHDGVQVGGLLDSAHQQQRDEQHDHDRGDVDAALVKGGREPLRQRDAERGFQEGVEVARPNRRRSPPRTRRTRGSGPTR